MNKFSFIFLVFFSGFGIQNAGNDWHLESSKNGIAVYSKTVPGNSVNAVKSVCTLNCSLSGMVALIVDVASYHKWIYHCEHAEVLKTISPLELIYHQETEAPWPASNRDFIGRLKISQDYKTGVISASVENMPDYIPEKPGVVRLKQFNERLFIIPLGRGKSEISYELLMDVGGNIPGWMVNLAITAGPYESLSEMTKLVNTGVYNNIHYPYIKDF